MRADRTFMGVFLAVTILAGFTLTSASPAAIRTANTAAWLPAPARTLAALDCKCRPSAARVARYEAILSRLARRCQESAGRLGYISKTATEILEQNGHTRTNLWLLREVDRKTPTRVSGRQPCRYVFALVVSSI